MLSLLAVVSTLASARMSRTSLLSLWASAGGLRRVLAAWIVLECSFYVVCCLLSLRMNVPGKVPQKAWDKPQRKEAWRKVLADPTQTTQQFVSGWFYRESRSWLSSSLRQVLCAFGLVHDAAYIASRKVEFE